VRWLNICQTLQTAFSVRVFLSRSIFREFSSSHGALNRSQGIGKIALKAFLTQLLSHPTTPSVDSEEEAKFSQTSFSLNHPLSSSLSFVAYIK
jgi:hypothetical protein